MAPNQESSEYSWTITVNNENYNRGVFDVLIKSSNADVQGESGAFILKGTPVTVEDIIPAPLPISYQLFQNYPNPFNPTTKIKYEIPASTIGTGHTLFIQLRVYDILGREVATLVNKQQQPGNYEVEFSALSFPSGVYFYQLKAGDYIQSKKMILLK